MKSTVEHGSTATTVTPDTSTLGSNPGLDASLIGGRGFEPHTQCESGSRLAFLPHIVSPTRADTWNGTGTTGAFALCVGLEPTTSDQGGV